MEPDERPHPVRRAALHQDSWGSWEVRLPGEAKTSVRYLSEVPAAIEGLLGEVALDEQVECWFRDGTDPLGRRGPQRLLAARHWTFDTVAGWIDTDLWDPQVNAREVVVTAGRPEDEFASISLFAITHRDNGHRSTQSIALATEQVEWVLATLRRNPETRAFSAPPEQLEPTDGRLSEIEETLARLRLAWEANSEMRLGQLVSNALHLAKPDARSHPELFYEDDAALSAAIEAMTRRLPSLNDRLSIDPSAE